MNVQRIIDLVGKPIAGVTLDIRTRTADGSLMYDHTEEEGPRIRALKSVEIRHKKDGPWLFWTWDRDTSKMSDCGYSGIRMDSHNLNDYYLPEVTA